jgi:hypothetical protein
VGTILCPRGNQALHAIYFVDSHVVPRGHKNVPTLLGFYSMSKSMQLRVHWLVQSSKSATLFVCLLLFHTSGFALSCTGLNDHFFISCVAGSCKGEFRAQEVHSGGACGRRSIIEPFPDNAIDILTDQMRRAVSTEAMIGIFQVTLTYRFYGKQPSSADDLKRAFDADDYDKPRIQVQKIENDFDIDKLRQEWESRANRELYRTVLYWTIEVISMLVALFLTYKSTALYRQRLLAYLTKTESHLHVLGPLSLQVALFIVGMISLDSVTGLAMIKLIAPIILMIWIYEFIIYVLYRIKYAKMINSGS